MYAHLTFDGQADASSGIPISGDQPPELSGVSKRTMIGILARWQSGIESSCPVCNAELVPWNRAARRKRGTNARGAWIHKRDCPAMDISVSRWVYAHREELEHAAQ
jgi:hypothetical protein